MGWMTGFELHRIHRYINKINHIARQIMEKPGKKSANPQPVATRLPTSLIHFNPKERSHDLPVSPLLLSPVYGQPAASCCAVRWLA